MLTHQYIPIFFGVLSNLLNISDPLWMLYDLSVQIVLSGLCCLTFSVRISSLITVFTDEGGTDVYATRSMKQIKIYDNEK